MKEYITLNSASSFSQLVGEQEMSVIFSNIMSGLFILIFLIAMFAVMKIVAKKTIELFLGEEQDEDSNHKIVS